LKRPSGMMHLWGPEAPPGMIPRLVRIYTPAGHDPARGGPLLLLFDGQNVFEDEPSYAGGWQTHRAIERLARRRPRPVVVAVDHGGVERIRELAPWDNHGAPGDLERLLDWIAGALLPRVRATYGVGAGPAATLVGGSSLGGLAALYAHFHRPEVFGGALAMSPSLWFAGRRLLGWLGERTTPWTSRIYLDCGAREARGAMLSLARILAEQLRQRGYGRDRLRFREDPHGAHDERAWRRRLPAALRFLYPLPEGRG